LPIVVMAVLFGIAVPGFTPKARLQAGEPDQRVEKALKKLGLKYTVDKDGDFKLIFTTEGDRTQVVFINSGTETLRKMEIREIWSPVAKFLLRLLRLCRKPFWRRMAPSKSAVTPTKRQAMFISWFSMFRYPPMRRPKSFSLL
jgi:hypothetical protein